MATLPVPPPTEVQPGGTSRQNLWFVVYVVLTVTLTLADTATPVEHVEWLLNVPLVWGAAVACTSKQLTWAAILASVSIGAGGILSPPGPVDRWEFLATRGIMVLTIWMIAIQWRLRMEAEANERDALIAQHEQELQAIRGLIPICAWCKNIRADSGAWKRIEQYIGDHSGATCTHGICPSAPKTSRRQKRDPTRPVRTNSLRYSGPVSVDHSDHVSWIQLFRVDRRAIRRLRRREFLRSRGEK